MDVLPSVTRVTLEFTDTSGRVFESVFFGYAPETPTLSVVEAWVDLFDRWDNGTSTFPVGLGMKVWRYQTIYLAEVRGELLESDVAHRYTARVNPLRQGADIASSNALPAQVACVTHFRDFLAQAVPRCRTYTVGLGDQVVLGTDGGHLNGASLTGLNIEYQRLLDGAQDLFVGASLVHPRRVGGHYVGTPSTYRLLAAADNQENRLATQRRRSGLRVAAV